LIETCSSEFWVDLDGLGLGFASEKKREVGDEERTERRKRKKERK